jgi:hypothetical protein
MSDRQQHTPPTFLDNLPWPFTDFIGRLRKSPATFYVFLAEAGKTEKQFDSLIKCPTHIKAWVGPALNAHLFAVSPWGSNIEEWGAPQTSARVLARLLINLHADFRLKRLGKVYGTRGAWECLFKESAACNPPPNNDDGILHVLPYNKLPKVIIEQRNDFKGGVFMTRNGWKNVLLDNCEEGAPVAVMVPEWFEVRQEGVSGEPGS